MRAIKFSFFVIVLFCLIFYLKKEHVYITKTGKKYHRENCYYLRYSKKKIDLKYAQYLDYTACEICTPEPNTKSNPNKSKDRNRAAVQCKGITKLGNRCKRRTKNKNQRCYQH